MAFVSYLRFNVKSGERDNFLAAFKAAEMLSRPKSIPGYKWGKLNEAPDGSHFMVIAEWDSEADYSLWQSRSIPELDKSIAKAFFGTLENPVPGTLFNTVLTDSD